MDTSTKSVVPNNRPVTEIKLDSPQQKIFNSLPFPLVLTPVNEKLTSTDHLLNWVKEDLPFLKQTLLEHGAVLFRGFPIECPEDFDAFVKAFDYEALPYVGGAAPRRVITGNVFTANEAPPDQLIPFHHEMAQVPTFPSALFFYCQTNPQSGGQTPLVLSNEIYKAMVSKHPDFVEKLEQEGVVYNRVLPNGDDPSSPIGRGWQSTYQSEDKQVAEKKCAEQGTTFEWLPDGCLRTRTATIPAIRTDERTGKKTWFNSIIAAYLGWNDSRNDAKKAVTFPDSTPMPEEAMADLESIFESFAIDFTWQKGDVVMVDNKQALHGRRSFVPPRRIMACLCK